MTLRRRVARRLERALLGAMMSVIACIVERRVLEAIRGTGREPLPPAQEGEFASARNGPAGQA